CRSRQTAGLNCSLPLPDEEKLLKHRSLFAGHCNRRNQRRQARVPNVLLVVALKLTASFQSLMGALAAKRSLFSLVNQAGAKAANRTPGPLTVLRAMKQPSASSANRIRCFP